MHNLILFSQEKRECARSPRYLLPVFPHVCLILVRTYVRVLRVLSRQVRRFTGGGTVVLGPGTCLCSFIMRGWPAGNAAGMSYHHIRATSSTTATPYQPSQSSSSLSSSSSSGVLAIDPKAVMAWSEDVYRPALEYLVGEAKATELFRYACLRVNVNVR